MSLHDLFTDLVVKGAACLFAADDSKPLAFHLRRRAQAGNDVETFEACPDHGVEAAVSIAAILKPCLDLLDTRQ